MTAIELGKISQNISPDEEARKNLMGLELFNQISTIISDTSISLPDALKKIVSVMAPAWMFPDICEISVHYEDLFISTPRFCKTQWKLTYQVNAYDGTPIEITVVYLEHRPLADNGPFRSEEVRLLQSVAHQILSLVNHKLLLRFFRKKEKESEYFTKKVAFIIENAPIPIFETLPNRSIVHVNQAFSNLTGEKPEDIQRMKLSDLKILRRTGKPEPDAIEKGIAASGDMDIQVSSGNKTVQYFDLPIIGQSGTVDSVINYYIDKTDQVTAIKDIITLIDSAKAGDLGFRINTDHFSGEFRQLTEGINETLDAVIGPLNIAAEYVDRISKGDIPKIITEPYSGDFNEIKNNLNTCIEAVNLLVTDTRLLTSASIEGKLDIRADPTRHQGDFRRVIEGVNATLDSIITPINEVVDTISQEMTRFRYQSQ